MWVLKEIQGKKFLLCEWEICIEINYGTTFCVQQNNIQALKNAKLYQASREPLSSAGG
jgi:hypothetical protein